MLLSMLLHFKEFYMFYPYTELQMGKQFESLCCSVDCLKTISGAAHMDTAVLKRYQLTQFIQHQLAAKL